MVTPFFNLKIAEHFSDSFVELYKKFAMTKNIHFDSLGFLEMLKFKVIQIDESFNRVLVQILLHSLVWQLLLEAFFLVFTCDLNPARGLGRLNLFYRLLSDGRIVLLFDKTVGVFVCLYSRLIWRCTGLIG